MMFVGSFVIRKLTGASAVGLHLSGWESVVVERYRSIIDVYVLLRRADGRVLLMERANTGYADGQFCPPSGHLEEGESVVAGAIREAYEEVGVVIAPADLTFVHVVHHRSPEMVGRVGFFFLAEIWDGEPTNREPHKCAGLLWTDPADPPSATVPYSAAALRQIVLGHQFSLDGWKEFPESAELSPVRSRSE